MGGSVKYDRLPTDDSSQGRGNVRHRFCCCQTQGVAFNLLVGIVVIANALFIGIEAELGALGPAGPQWTGLKADMQGVGMDGKGSAKFVQAELQHGLNADQHVKEEVEQRLEGALHKNVNVHESLTLPDGSRKLRSAAYTVCEYFFVTFFLLEMLLRFCDLGCKGYCCDYPWLLLDVTVVTTGVLDVLLPFFLGARGGQDYNFARPSYDAGLAHPEALPSVPAFAYHWPGFCQGFHSCGACGTCCSSLGLCLGSGPDLTGWTKVAFMGNRAF